MKLFLAFAFEAPQFTDLQEPLNTSSQVQDVSCEMTQAQLSPITGLAHAKVVKRWPSDVTFTLALDWTILFRGYTYGDLALQVEGGLQHLHHSPASRKRRCKGNLVPGGITGPPCSWEIYLRGPGPPGWGSLR
jgi:hypothetical protein